MFTAPDSKSQGRQDKFARSDVNVATSLEMPAPKFSLRYFLVTLVLLGYNTMREKLETLYEIFNQSNTANQGINMNQAFELIKTIFERCLYFWPGQQLYFQLETILNQQTSYVHRAYWTYNLPEDRLPKIKDEGTFDVTSEVQQAFVDYFNLFGTKVIDFNHDTTHFKTLEDIVGSNKSRELLKIKLDYEKKQRKTSSKVPSYLVLFAHS